MTADDDKRDALQREEFLWCLGNAIGRCEAALTGMRAALPFVMHCRADDCEPLLGCIRLVADIRDRLLEQAPELPDDEDEPS